MSTPASARLNVLAAAALFSTGGALIKLCSLTAWQVASFRSGIAALVLLAVVPSVRRSWTRRTWAVAVAYAATMVLFVAANKLTTAVNTIFLQSTAPLYVLLLSPWLLDERPGRADILYMVSLAGGMALFFVGQEAPRATATDPALGNVLAACAGLTWALTILGLRWLGRPPARTAAPTAAAGERTDPALAAAVAGSLVAFAGALPAALPVGDVSSADWAVLAALGALQIGLAYVCLTRGVKRVSALEVSLLLLLEPVLSPLWAWLVHGEEPAALSAAGAAVILTATAARALRSRGTPGAPSVPKAANPLNDRPHRGR